MPEDKMSIDEMPVDKISVDEMPVDKIPLHFHFKKLAYVALFNKFIHILLKEV